MKRVYFFSTCAVSAIAAMAAQSADAQVTGDATASAEAPVEERASSDAGLIPDIIVTAQKRSENLQKVPIAVSVATSADLTNAGASDVQSLKVAIPSVNLARTTGWVLPAIRGVISKATGALLESPNAIYLDGVYYGSTTSTLLSFSNVEQVSVLKGPQGTLFGRNATGGVIQITTRDPGDSFSGNASISYGNYETLIGTAYVSGPLGTGVSADLAVQGRTMGDGYGVNMFNGEDTYRIKHDYGIRSKWKFELGENTVLRLIGDYSDHKGSDTTQRYGINEPFPPVFGAAYGGSPWDTNVDVQPFLRVKAGGASATIDQSIGSLTLTSITAYRSTNFLSVFDTDKSPVFTGRLEIRQKDKQFSQELQLQSDTSGPFTWTIGGYYYYIKSGYYPFISTSPGARVLIRTKPTAESIAGFGQATYKLADALSVTAGLRYTTELRKSDVTTQVTLLPSGFALPPSRFQDDARFNKLTWRLALDYQINPDVLVYASYNRGFKAGGYNPTATTIPFRPEVLDAYEVGLKSVLIDRRLRLNAAAFYYDYTDVQILRFIDAGGTTTTGIYNGARAEIYGLDVDLTAAISDAFNVRAAYEYLHGRYKSFPDAVIGIPDPAVGFRYVRGDASGNHTVLTPESTLSVTPQYRIALGDDTGLTLTGTAYYNSGYYHEPDNTARQPSYWTFNASARLDMRNHSITFFMNNITNEAVTSIGGNAPLNAFGVQYGLTRQTFEPPRTYGVRYAVAF